MLRYNTASLTGYLLSLTTDAGILFLKQVKLKKNIVVPCIIAAISPLVMVRASDAKRLYYIAL